MIVFLCRNLILKSTAYHHFFRKIYQEKILHFAFLLTELSKGIIVFEENLIEGEREHGQYACYTDKRRLCTCT